MSRIALAAVATTGLVVGFNPLKTLLHDYTQHPASGWVVVVAFAAVILAIFASQLSLVSKFVWNCFLQPLGKNADQAGRLNRFYQGQAASESRVPGDARRS
jgi:betaine lipid synthase